MRHRPSLFQHIGTHSSLAGKLQKLRERDFGATQHFIAHKDNPAAKISTTLKAYKTHSGIFFDLSFLLINFLIWIFKLIIQSKLVHRSKRIICPILHNFCWVKLRFFFFVYHESPANIFELGATEELHIP